MASDYNLGTARGKLEIDASGAEAGAKKGEKAVGGFTDKLEKSSSGLATAGGIIGGVGVAIGAAFVGAVNQAASFEKQMSAVEAVSGASAGEMEKLRAKALQLGADTAFSAGEAGSAMEELVKAGLSVDDVLNGAADATVALAAAGEIALPEAATIASNAMNQFSLSAKEMPKIADLIAGAANASAIDVSDFGQSLTQVGAIANLVGLSFEDTAVAIAEMGNAGIKGSDAGTSLKTMLSNLQPSTKAQSKAMRELGLLTEKGGNAFFDANGKLKPLRDIQELLRKSTEKLTAAQKQQYLETIFGSDAIRAAAILTKSGAQGFDKMAGSMKKVTAEAVAAQRLNNLTGDLDALKGSLETVAIQLGTIFLPALRKVVQAISKAVNWFSKLSDGQKKTIVTIAAVLGVVLLIVGALLGFAAAIGAVIGALAPLAAVIGITVGALAGWLVVIPLIIAAIVLLVILIIKNWDKIKAFTISVWNAIVGFLKSVWNSVISFFQSTGAAIAGFFSGLWNGIKSVVMTVWNAIAGVLTGVFNTIKGIIETYINIWKTIIQAGINVIKGIWSKIWGTFGPLIKAIFNLIKAIFELGFRAFLFVVVTVSNKILSVVKTVFNAVKSFFTTVFNAIKTFLTTVWNAIYSYISGRVNAIRNIIVAVFGAIRTFVSTVFNGIKGFVISVWNSIYNAVSGPVGRIKTAVTNAFNAAKTAATNAFESLRDSVGVKILAAYNKVKGVVDQIRGIFANAGSWLVNAGRNIIQGLLDGITGMIGKVTSKLKELTNMIPKVKGPERVDKKLLKPAGEWIMEGFNESLQDGIKNVQRTLSGVTGDLPTFVPVFTEAVAAAGGSTTLSAPAPGGEGAVTQITLHSYNPVGKTDVETLSDEATRLSNLGVLG